jgi:multiple sugar transport system permease protein
VTTPTAQRASSAALWPRHVRPRQRVPLGRVFAYIVLITTSLAILAPFLWALYTSFRPFADTADRGYFSLPGTLTLKNYTGAWEQADLPRYFLNTVVIVLPAMAIVLLLASFLAYAVARFSFKFNLTLLMVFTAGNLLPQQVIITPLYRLYLMLPLPGAETSTWYDSYFGVMMIHVAFQLGFCTFVMSNYMRTIPRELTEAALVDGASVWRQFWQVIIPLCRAPLAALATLEFTWIYNDFFWALVLLPSGDKRPMTSALNNLEGIYFTNENLIAAGSVLAALPTVIVYIVLQRHFVAGLTLGASKG